MRLRVIATSLTCLALLGVGLPAANAVVLTPRASTSATPAEVLKTVPAAAPLRVGYKRGSFPVTNPVKKDKRGCTLRNQLLIKTAIKRPKIGAGCKLTGGAWSLDFGARTETNPAKVRVTRLVPDVYVYGQGGYMWTPAQRAAYSTYVAVPKQTRIGYRVTAVGLNQSSWATTSLTGDRYLKKVYNTLVVTSTPSEGDLETLKALNPTLFEGWTLATLLNAKAWGISLSPSVYANFQATIAQCSQDPEKNNPCTQTYTVTTPNAEDPNKPGTTTTYDIPVMPVEASAMAPVLPEIIQGYNQPKTGDVVSRHLFGLHAPAIWTYDEVDKVDGPVDPATIPSVPVGYTRLWDTETTWADIEPSKGQWVWRKLAKQIQVAQARDAKVMLVLGGTPAWASTNGGKTGAPKDLADWRNYVSSVCRQFGASINAFEIWNEANLTTFWAGSPAQMADLTKAAFEEIRACNPGALVVAANTTSRAEGSFGSFFPAYLQELKARGWPADAYSVHSYPKASGGNGDRIAGISQFRMMLALAGAPFTTVFDTEVNYGMEGLGQGKVEITGESAAALMSRTYVDSVRYGFGSTFWYVWTPDVDPKMGIQFTPGAVAEQRAWNRTYDWLVGAQFHACGEAPDPKGLVVCQFDRNGENFAIAWYGEVNSNSMTKLPKGYFNGLGSKCDNLLNGTCDAMLNGEVPLTSTPVRIYGPALATIDQPESIKVQPNPLPQINVGQVTPLTVSVTNAQGKYLPKEKLTLKLEGPITRNGVQGPMEITTAENGMITLQIQGQQPGTGTITLTSVRKPDLVVTATLTVADQKTVVFESVHLDKDGKHGTGAAVITGFPDGYVEPNVEWVFNLVDITGGKRTVLSRLMASGYQRSEGVALVIPQEAPIGGAKVVAIEALLRHQKSGEVRSTVLSNRLTVPAPGGTTFRK